MLIYDVYVKKWDILHILLGELSHHSRYPRFLLMRMYIVTMREMCARTWPNWPHVENHTWMWSIVIALWQSVMCTTLSKTRNVFSTSLPTYIPTLLHVASHKRECELHHMEAMTIFRWVRFPHLEKMGYVVFLQHIWYNYGIVNEVKLHFYLFWERWREREW